MDITIDKMLLESLVKETEDAKGSAWISDPISIGSSDYFLEVKNDGCEISIKMTQTNLKGLELEILSVIEEL